MSKINEPILVGGLLLAEPFLSDPYFRRAVILVCEHNEQGSIGFIINKSIEMGINDLMTDFPYFDSEVFYGGPVQTDTLHYIHNIGNLLEGSIKIGTGLWWGGDFEKLQILIRTGEVQKSDIRFYVGYTGWGANQLDTEMEMGTWKTAKMRREYLFTPFFKDLWKNIMYSKGDKYEILSRVAEYPSWN